MGFATLPAREPVPPRTNPRIATGDCQPHIATVDRVGTSTEHMLGLRFRQARCRWLAPETSKPRSSQVVARVLKGLRGRPLRLRGNKLPRDREGAPYTPPREPSEEVARVNERRLRFPACSTRRSPLGGRLDPGARRARLTISPRGTTLPPPRCPFP